MAKIVNSWNDWDPLKRVIVGRPEGSSIRISLWPEHLCIKVIKRTLTDTIAELIWHKTSFESNTSCFF